MLICYIEKITEDNPFIPLRQYYTGLTEDGGYSLASVSDAARYCRNHGELNIDGYKWYFDGDIDEILDLASAISLTNDSLNIFIGIEGYNPPYSNGTYGWDLSDESLFFKLELRC